MSESQADSARAYVKSPRVKAQEIESRYYGNVDDVIDAINEQEKRNFTLGVVLLIVAICTWITGLELVNSVLKGEEFQKPIFLAVLTGSCFTLNFVPNMISLIKSFFRSSTHSNVTSSPMLSSSDLEIDSQAVMKFSTMSARPEVHHEGPEMLSQSEVFLLAFQVACIYLCYNVMVLSSLKYTSASNQTILGSTTTFFTLCLGTLLKVDRFSMKKVICVVSSLIGVILINIGSEDLSGGPSAKSSSKSPVFGNFLALIGAFFYALYLLTMKLKCGTGSKTTNERELFGWVGVITLAVGIPLLIVVHMLGIEEFQLPLDSSVLVMVLINAVFSVTSDYVTILAMLLTSPLVTSLALTSSIPITIFVDFIILDYEGESSTSRLLLYGFGVVSIMLSVILININISSENELIEEVIEETLEGAMQCDEVLSPILSPYLSSSSAHNMSRRDIGLHTPLSPKFSNWRKRPAAPLARLSSEDSRFTLNARASHETEESPLRNQHHSKSLYKNDRSNASESSVHEASPGLYLSGGANHKFSLEHMSQSRGAL
ncbi:hypothetical protein OXX59_007407 [Metschnikowia pulcherrima]